MNLKKYTPKGELKGVPKTIIKKLLQNQVQQGNPEDITVFENSIGAGELRGGFDWNKTVESKKFWNETLNKKDYSKIKLKFKLIKEFPLSPEINTIVEFKDEKDFNDGLYDIGAIPNLIVQDCLYFTEFWEEIIEE